MSETMLAALGLGLLSGSALLVGAVLGLLRRWPARWVAAVMAFGSGALISALAFDLVAESREKAGFGPVAIGLMAGSLLFVAANDAINQRGGFLRKPTTLRRFLRELRRRRAVAVLQHLSRVELMRNLPPADVICLLPFVEAHRYHADQPVFHAGEPGDALYLVESGTVEVGPHADAGSGADAMATRTYTLEPGDAFGEMALLAGHPHHSTAIAKSPVHLWIIRKHPLEVLEQRSPTVAAALKGLRARHLTAEPGNVAVCLRQTGRALPDPGAWLTEAVHFLDRNQIGTAVLTQHEQHEQVREHAPSGTGVALFLGALLDGIPESIVVGASLLAHTTASMAFVVAVFISNVPEALSSAATMREHAFHPRRILGLWGGLVIASGLAAFLGNALLAGAPPWLIAGVEGLAAGSILAMLADTLMPEALEMGGPLTAVWTALGFLVAVLVKSTGG